MSRRVRITIALACTGILMVFFLNLLFNAPGSVQPRSGQPQPVTDARGIPLAKPGEIVSNDPWPLLPDGRVLFDFYGEKIAIPRCPRCLSDEFWVLWDEADVRQMARLKIDEAIREPGKLRLMLARGDAITFETGNTDRMEGLFLDHFSRHQIIEGPILLTIYRRPFPDSGCSISSTKKDTFKLCTPLHAAALQHDGRDAAGFVHLGMIGIWPPAEGQTIYVSSLSDYRDTTGDPLYFICSAGQNCVNSAYLRHGFFVRPSISLNYGFVTERYRIDQFKEYFDRLRSAMEYLIVTNNVSEVSRGQ